MQIIVCILQKKPDVRVVLHRCRAMQTTQGLVALRVGICVSVEGIGLRKVV